MNVTISPTVYGRMGGLDYYLTTMKARHAVNNIKPAGAMFGELPPKREAPDRPGRPAPTDEQEQPANKTFRLRRPFVLALEGGDAEFTPLEAAENTQFIGNTNLEIGVIGISETGIFYILSGEAELDEIRAQIQAGNEEVAEDDLPVMIVDHKNTPEGREDSRRLMEYLEDQNTGFLPLA